MALVKRYQRINLKGEKVYVPAVRGRHVVRWFRRASEAEAHGRRLLERLARLREAARRGFEVSEVSLQPTPIETKSPSAWLEETSQTSKPR